MKKTLLALLILITPTWSVAEPALPDGIIKITARPAPPLKLANLDGEKFSLSAGRQQWAFVHFWASWCGPCRKEMPAIQQLIKTMSNDPWQFFIVNTAESEDTVFTFLAAVAPDISTLLDKDGLTTELWRPRGLPSTYLVDPAGQLQYLVIGGQPWHKPAYRQFLRQLSMSAQ